MKTLHNPGSTNRSTGLERKYRAKEMVEPVHNLDGRTRDSEQMNLPRATAKQSMGKYFSLTIVTFFIPGSEKEEPSTDLCLRSSDGRLRTRHVRPGKSSAHLPERDHSHGRCLPAQPVRG